MSSQIEYICENLNKSLVGKQKSCKMSIITLDSILIGNNPAMFTDPMKFQITFTTLSPLPQPLQWKMIYVGSATSQQHDQVLEQFEIGPFLEASTMKFQVECNPPNHNLIPSDQLLCVTALILTVSYMDQQFIRVGYYIHNQYLGEQEVESSNYPILPIMITGIRRTIIADKPRITHFSIKWNGSQSVQESSNRMTEKQENDVSSNSLDNCKIRQNKLIEKQQQKGKQQYVQNHDKFSTESHSLQRQQYA